MNNKFTRYKNKDDVVVEEKEESDKPGLPAPVIEQCHCQGDEECAICSKEDSPVLEVGKIEEAEPVENKGMPDKITKEMLAPGQLEAEGILTSDNWWLYFLTGQAGSGKSFLINYLRQNYRCAVMGSTGVSAQLIGGCTFHKGTGYWEGNTEKQPQYSMKRLAESLQGFDFLIVDECSMISLRMFDTVYDGLRLLMANGIRIIFVGDFMQLPPVPSRLPAGRGKYITLPNSDVFCFHSQHWARPNYDIGRWEHTEIKGINLDSQHRQSDMGFVNALNMLRKGIIDDNLRDIMRNHTSFNLPEDCVILAPRRKTVDDINMMRLSKLEGKEYAFGADIQAKNESNLKMDDYEVQKLAKQSRFPHDLKLKEGARVMMLVNDQNGQFVNGTAGEVASFDFDNDTIYVKTDDGREIGVMPCEEVICDHRGKEKLYVITGVRSW
jgi:ATP-dependent DNA helicase PIF1